ncbi:MAG: AbrB/MazE/SpoVT family DNA-binding domain-containing protein [Candidatus Babeliaceae bacterium]
MLKKLVKYGNSNALVLDKPLLELLNIEEGTVVRISTDGKSLIINPVADTKNAKISWDSETAPRIAIQQHLAQIREKVDMTDPKYAEIYKKFAVHFAEYFADRAQKYGTRFCETLNNNEQFKEELANLAQKYDPINQSEQYIQEMIKLRYKFVPELKELDEDGKSKVQALGQQIEEEIKLKTQEK